MLPSKPTLTIAIPAHNEQVTIVDLLASLVSQSRTQFRLQKIVVYSDGSTDSTDDFVRRFAGSHSRIQLLAGRKRLGKMRRLNQIFGDLQSDVLVVLDADIGLVGSDFLDPLVSRLASDPTAVMVAAHQLLLRPRDFLGRLMHASFVMWDYIRLSVPRQDHVQNFYGAATAYRRSFAKKLHLPPQATEERVYIYSMAKKVNGFRYTFASQVVSWPVGTLEDFVSLSHRSFGTVQPELVRFFGPAVTSLHLIPFKYKVLGTIKSLINQPIYTPLAFLFNLGLNFLTQAKPVRRSPLWTMTLSTKKPISHG